MSEGEELTAIEGEGDLPTPILSLIDLFSSISELLFYILKDILSGILTNSSFNSSQIRFTSTQKSTIDREGSELHLTYYLETSENSFI